MQTNTMIDQSENEGIIDPSPGKTIEELRSEIVRMMPELASSIDEFNEEEIHQIIREAFGQEKIQQSQEQRRSNLIARFANDIPSMTEKQANQLYDEYGPEGLSKIYQEMKKQQNLKVTQRNNQNEEMKSNDYKSGREFSNGEVNVYEMKKTLVERMPQYRQEIKNMGDEELKAIFKQLQKDFKPLNHEYSLDSDLHDKVSRKRGRPRKGHFQDEQNENPDYFFDYPKNNYDTATVPMEKNQSTYYTQHQTSNYGKNDFQTPYSMECQETPAKDEQPFCQITLNFRKQDFLDEGTFEKTMRILGEVRRSINR